ncbi:MAG TPA: winged helix-turn-helix transcriptional regulator [Candidatus Coprousia avicola]|nr:winged helix-turn-helix transcriptional regulator [Candidatus Coprousia avicola]
MDYEEAARRLIVYSQGLAKGSLGTARSLAVGEAPVLQYLADQGTEMNPSVLADTLGYTRPRMTRILDSLVSKGYVERKNDERDRRKVLVRVTPEGVEHSKKQGESSVAAVAQQLSALGDSSARELLNVLEKAYSITYDREPFEKPKRKKNRS